MKPRRLRSRKPRPQLGPRPILPLQASERLRKAYRRLLASLQADALALLTGVRTDALDDKTKRGLAALRAKAKREAQELGPELSIVSKRVEKQAAVPLLDVVPLKLIGVANRDLVSGAALDAFRRRNLDLISSLAEEQVDELGELLDDTEGLRVEDLRKKILGRFDVSRSKADLLARDQVLKLNAQITQSRQREAGITRYQWSTSSDERVRPMHAELDGEIFSWDDPPITNDDGDRNHPGEDYQCRCVAIPIMPEIEDGSEDAEGE